MLTWHAQSGKRIYGNTALYSTLLGQRGDRTDRQSFQFTFLGLARNSAGAGTSSSISQMRLNVWPRNRKEMHNKAFLISMCGRRKGRKGEIKGFQERSFRWPGCLIDNFLHGSSAANWLAFYGPAVKRFLSRDFPLQVLWLVYSRNKLRFNFDSR